MTETPAKSRSPITTEHPNRKRHEKNQSSAILRATPGRILQQEFLNGFKLSQAGLAKRTGIPRSVINKGRRSISTETAFALGFFFNMDPQFWINLQSQSNIRRARLEKSTAILTQVTPLDASMG